LKLTQRTLSIDLQHSFDPTITEISDPFLIICIAEGAKIEPKF